MTEKRRRVRRRDVPARFYKTRRFRIGALVSLFLALFAVTFVIAWLESPEKRKLQFLADGSHAYNRGDYSEAAILFRKHLDLQPDSTLGRYYLALSLFRLGREDEAVIELKDTARQDPDFDRAHLLLADHYRDAGDFRASLKSARAAIDRPPAPARAYVLLAEVKLGLGDAVGAIDAFRRALEIDPDLIEPNLKLGDLYLSRQYQGLEDMKEGLADSRYRRAVELAEGRLAARPRDVKARLRLAKAKAGLGEFRDAERLLANLVEEKPGEPEYRLLLARLHLSSDAEDRTRTAGEVFRTAWQETPTPKIAIEWARLADRTLGDPNQAVEILEPAVAKFPDDRSVRIALVDHLLRAKLIDRAKVVMAETSERFAGHPSVVEAEGDLKAATGDEDGAAAAWEAALAINPQGINVRRKLIEFLLPRVLTALAGGVNEPADLERLEEHLAFFLDPDLGINPADLRARSWLAQLRYAQGDFDASARLLGGEGRSRPQSWLGLRILGVSHLRSGDYFEASRTLYQALNHPDSPGTPEEFEAAWMASYRVGTFRREAEIAERAVTKWPDEVEWRLRLARSYVRAGESELALSTCQVLRKMVEGTTDVRSLLLAARIHQRKNEIAAARRLLEDATAIRRDPETRGALYRFLAETGDTKLAEKGFLALVEENPRDPDAFLRFGDFLFERHDEQGAISQYRKALELEPGSAEAIRRIAEIQIARAASEEDAIRIADEAVKRLTEASPDDPFALYFEGKVLLLKGRAVEAVPVLTHYVKKNPHDAAGAYYLAIAHRRSGNLEAARNGLLAALSLDPGMTEAKLELATLYFTEGLQARWRGDSERAVEAFRSVRGLDPEEPHTRRLLVESLARIGKLDEAMAEARSLLETHPDDPGALFVVALGQARSGDFEAAEVTFVRLAGILPENHRSHLYLGLVLAELKKFDDARESLGKAWQISPGAKDVLHAIASLEVLAGRPEEAIRFVQAELGKRPDDAWLHRLLGDLLRERNRPDDAIRAYRRAFEIDSNETIALAMAAAIIADSGDLEGAAALLASGEARAERTAGLKTLRGKLLFSLGRRADAKLALREAIAEGGAGVEPLRELGMLLLDAEEWEEGIRLLDKAVKDGLVDAAVFFRLALAATERGDLKRAEMEYGKVLQLAPEDPATMNNLALVLSRTPDRFEDALRLARRAAELEPDSLSVADTLGWVLYRGGKYDEAARILRAVAAKLPNDAVAQFHAGMACYKAYLWDAARPLLRKALELDAGLEGAESAKKALKEIG